ncbi:DUF1295-domain-containing protein [Sparassis latifolia]
MTPILVLDHFYLSISLLVTIGYQLLGFAIAWTFQFDKITDFTGGSNVFILSLLTWLLGGNFSARNILANVFVMVWAVRLATFLLYRVLKYGSDSRFDDIRSHFFKFFGFWVGQIIWVWTISLPLTILNSPALSEHSSYAVWGKATDILGVIFFWIGWSFETSADLRKFMYKASNPPKDKPIDVGLWKWSRHPSYFGEMLCWWGIWLICVTPSLHGSLSPSTKAAQYGAVVSPLFTMSLLLFASGLPTAEKPQARKFYLLSHPLPGSEEDHSSATRRTVESNIEDDSSTTPVARLAETSAWENYQAYRAQTSILLPLPPALYRHLPRFVKQTILCDWPMYEFKPERDLQG